MRAFLQVLSAVILMLSTVHAQRLLPGADSLALVKPKPAKPAYVFPPGGIGTAILVLKEPMSIELPPPKARGGGLVTMLTGIGTGRSDSSNMLLAHEIKLDDPLKSWRVHMFCGATTSVDKDRVKDASGAYSVNKTTTVAMHWDKGSEGYLLEQSDTVGVFVTIWDPSSDEKTAGWLKSLDAQYEIPAVAVNWSGFPGSKDHALYGKLRDKYFYVIVSGLRYVSLILIDEKPVGLFQSDFNDLVAGKKWRIPPYVLLDKSLDESQREDVMRLAMLSWLTRRSVSRAKYVTVK